MAGNVYPDLVEGKQYTAEEVRRFLNSPRLVARRVQEMTDFAFVSDLLLTGRADATGSGAIMVEDDAIIFADEDPEIITPGAEYPLVTVGESGASTITVRKTGFDSQITDERVSRDPGNAIQRTLGPMVNTMIRYFDTLSMNVIASRVTGTYAATATWNDGGQIVEDILLADAKEVERERGYSYDAVLLSPVDYAKVVARLIRDGMMPREQGNPLLRSAARSFNFLDKRIIQSVHNPFTDPVLIDTANLGGIVTEDIGSPEYTRTPRGIDVWTRRDTEEIDGWRLRCRRIAAPYVTGPGAAIRITGTK